MNKLSTAARIALAVLLIYAGYLALLAQSLGPEIFIPLFSEQGPFEEMSIVLWVALGALLMFHDPRSPRVWALAALAFVFAAREADLHKAFTVMSISKSRFYISPDVPVMQKIIGGLVLLAVVALIIHLARVCWQYFFRQGGLRTPVGQVLVLPVLLLPISKVLDRLTNGLRESFGIIVPESLNQFIAAFEEGMEMAMPVLFIAALLLYQASRREAAASQAPLLSQGKP